jgi:hypothetical protein
MTDNELFTIKISKYLDVFVKDIANDREKVLKVLDDFPGKDHLAIKKAILEGPETLDKTDAKLCKSLFNFIEYYSTNSISNNIEINYVGKPKNE